VVVEALRMRAAPEGSRDHLLEFLKLYRDAVQLVVNELWSLNAKVSRKKLHKMFYDKLRKWVSEHTTLRGYMSTLRA
jgi:hypothetical protein